MRVNTALTFTMCRNVRVRTAPIARPIAVRSAAVRTRAMRMRGAEATSMPHQAFGRGRPHDIEGRGRSGAACHTTAGATAGGAGGYQPARRAYRTPGR